MNLALLQDAYAGKRVFVTGHTGFKGGWLALWLRRLGAEVIGYALPPDQPRGMFHAAGVAAACEHHLGDVRDERAVRQAIVDARPDVVFHLAAQALVRRSYEVPLETFDTNVRGTAHVLEALKALRAPVACVVITSDKCYENQERDLPYREEDPLGGHDVYSMSKAAAELVASSWRRSFFPLNTLKAHGVKVATARAGNVIGGGDWSVDRIVPDAITALSEHRPIGVRSPKAVRPWQHVLEPLAGYLWLGAKLLGPEPGRYCEGWNFGPDDSASIAVAPLVDKLIHAWGQGRWKDISRPDAVHEASLLRLAIDKARVKLGWSPR
ncbi:MAG: rfbG, partial [Myxococcaceae bacterium]|nr:rfbG [Myxococcaceae bacterium]